MSRFVDLINHIEVLDPFNNPASEFDLLNNKMEKVAKEAHAEAERYEKKHIVFISVPMTDRVKSVVESEIQIAVNDYLRIRGWDAREVSFITNLNCPKAPEYMDVDQAAAWYLGEAIKKMAGCDEALFVGYWTSDRGCIMEKQVCALYGIPTRMINGYIPGTNRRRG